LLLAIAAVLAGTLLFGLDHRTIRAGGLLGVAGAFLGLMGIWLAARRWRGN